jgi:hypothetical protein
MKKYLKRLSPERKKTAKTITTCRGKCFPLIIILTTLSINIFFDAAGNGASSVTHVRPADETKC